MSKKSSRTKSTGLKAIRKRLLRQKNIRSVGSTTLLIPVDKVATLSWLAMNLPWERQIAFRSKPESLVNCHS
jgi:hypothetical protein